MDKRLTPSRSYTSHRRKFIKTSHPYHHLLHPAAAYSAIVTINYASYINYITDEDPYLIALKRKIVWLLALICILFWNNLLASSQMKIITISLISIKWYKWHVTSSLMLINLIDSHTWKQCFCIPLTSKNRGSATRSNRQVHTQHRIQRTKQVAAALQAINNCQDFARQGESTKKLQR
jgi:formate/nitrite transporter FocA (FNT family)